MQKMNAIPHAQFQEIIWRHYRQHRRSFSWREQVSPYRVVVSEIMLQQTQTDRVAKKFDEFVMQFSDFSSLASASFADVLKYWKGLGYNRRALNLQRTAQIVVEQFSGRLPSSVEQLELFPGIGKATARSIYAFAFDKRTAFIETNIRTVFLHFFFANTFDVHDRDILALVEQTLPSAHYRDWYYALMDYGVMLKNTVGNLNAQSIHYKKQSKFLGSDRQLRGKILAHLLAQTKVTSGDFCAHFHDEKHRFKRILEELCKEGMVQYDNHYYSL